MSCFFPAPRSCPDAQIISGALLLCLLLSEPLLRRELRDRSPHSTPLWLCLGAMLPSTKRKILCWTHWATAAPAVLLDPVPGQVSAAGLSSSLVAYRPFPTLFVGSYTDLPVLLPTGLMALLFHFTEDRLDRILGLEPAFRLGTH